MALLHGCELCVTELCFSLQDLLTKGEEMVVSEVTWLLNYIARTPAPYAFVLGIEGKRLAFQP